MIAELRLGPARWRLLAEELHAIVRQPLLVSRQCAYGRASPLCRARELATVPGPAKARSRTISVTLALGGGQHAGEVRRARRADR